MYRGISLHIFKPLLPSERSCGTTQGEGEERRGRMRRGCRAAPAAGGWPGLALADGGAGAVPPVAAHSVRSSRGSRGASRGWGERIVPAGRGWKGSREVGLAEGLLAFPPPPVLTSPTVRARGGGDRPVSRRGTSTRSGARGRQFCLPMGTL